MVVFGGIAADCRSPLNDTWVLTNANGLGGTPNWIQLDPRGELPAGRSLHAAAYDPANDRMIIFGGDGTTCSIPPMYNDVWVLAGASGTRGTPVWTELTPDGPAPKGLAGSTAVYDSVRNRLIVFGGNGGESFCGQTTNGVWILSNANGLGGTPAWTLITPSGQAPSARWDHFAAYDPAKDRMTIFGGDNACGNSFDDTSVLTGVSAAPAWTRLTQLGTPPNISGDNAAAVYDPASNRMTVILANSRQAFLLTDANGAGAPTWSQLTTTAIPPARLRSSLIYDPASGNMTMFGGAGASSLLNDVWVLTAPMAGCDYAVASALFGVSAYYSEGRNEPDQVGTFEVTAPAECAWTAESALPWIKIRNGSSGTGNGTVAFVVARNPDAAPRRGSLTVAGQPQSIVQAGTSCTSLLPEIETTIGAAGGVHWATVVTAPLCWWAATGGATWLRNAYPFASWGMGIGVFGTETSQNQENATRTGTMSVAGQTYTLRQMKDNSGSCTPRIQSGAPAPDGFTMERASGTQAGIEPPQVYIGANTGCSWTAASNSPWITVRSGSRGDGNGAVRFEIAANTGVAPRRGTLTIAGATHTVAQAGTSCSSTLLQDSAAFAGGGGRGRVWIVFGSDCTIANAKSSAPWITLALSNSLYANYVDFTVAPNTTGARRTGQITVEGNTYIVTQETLPCAYALTAASAAFSAAGGTGSITLSAFSGCPWTAVANANWITIQGASAGTGGGIVTFTIAPNSSPAARSGTIAIAGQNFTVTQSGVPQAAPRLSLSTAVLNFQEVAVGSVGSPRAVILMNSGNAPLNITSKSIGGANAGDYAYFDTCAGPVDAGGSCTVAVTFAPKGPGTRAALLRIDSDTQEGPQTVNLSGVGVASEIAPQLADAFSFSGPYPKSDLVTYTNRDGQIQTVVAFPGQIFLVVPPDAIDAAAAAALIQANRGTVIGQIPKAGLYWARVAVGTESDFIGALQPNPAVVLVVPDAPLETLDANATPLPIPLRGDPSRYPLLPLPGALTAQIDVFGGQDLNDCGLTHGESVNRLLARNDQTVTAYEFGGALREGEHGFAQSNGEDVGYGIARMAAGALQKGQKLIVNVSLGAKSPNDGQNREQCESDPANALCTSGEGNYAGWKTNKFAFWVGIASELQHMPDDLRDNTLVVLSAGNSGLNLTREIGLLRSFFPKAFDHMLIVGSTQSIETEPGTWSESVYPNHNHSYCLDENALAHACGDGDASMIYAPGVDVSIPGTNGCRLNGTSFATPQVANLAARLARKYPNLTTAVLVRAIMGARRAGGMSVLPAMQQVESRLPQPNPLTFTVPATLPAASVGALYSYSFCNPAPATGTACGSSASNPSGGITPYAFQLESRDGPLPVWISLSANGLLSGTPTATAAHALRICAADAAGTRICLDTSIEVKPPEVSLLRLDLDPATLVGGVPVQGTVTLSGPAGPGDVVVRLTSDSPFATVQATVTVPATRSSTTFPVTTYAVTSNTPVIIYAWLGEQNRGRPLLLIPAVALAMSKLELNTNAVTGGQSVTGTVTLNAAAAADVTVTLRSDNTLAQVQANVKVDAGTSSKEFTITTSPAGVRTLVTISATAGGVTKTAILTLNPGAASGDTWIGKLAGESVPGGACAFSKFVFSYTLSVTLPSNVTALLASGGVIPAATGSISGTETATRDSLASCTLTNSSISNVPVTLDFSKFSLAGGRILVNAAQTLIFQRIANGPQPAAILSLVLSGRPRSETQLAGTWTSSDQVDKATQSLTGDFTITKQ